MSGASTQSLIKAKKQGVQGFRKHQVAVAMAVLCITMAQAQTAQESTLERVDVVAPAVFGVTQNLGMAVGAGALGNVTQKDTPFSSTVVTSEQILEQASQKLGDLFVQDASVSDNSGTYTGWGTYLSVRGMDLDWQNSYRIDGRPFLGYAATLPYEHFEQIELLKGATGFMYGFGSPGGVLNYVTKKPTDAPTRSVSLGYSTSSLVRANADLGGRIGDGAVGYRLNVTREEGKTANKGPLERTSFLLALDAKLSDRLSWELQSLYMDRLAQDTEPTIKTGSYTGSALPTAIKNDQKLVGAGNYVDNQFAYLSTGLKYQINPDWQAQTNFSHSYTKTRRNENVLTLLNASGNYTTLQTDYAERYQYNYVDAQVQGRVRTGGLRHNIVAGVSWQQLLNDYASLDPYYASGVAGNIYTQNTNGAFSIGSFDNFGLYRAAETVQQTAFVSDRIELNDRWSLLGGLRMTNFELKSLNTSGVVTSTYDKSGVVTPTLAVMNKLTPETMAYASYVESLQPGSVVAANDGSGNNYSNAGQILNPLVSKQWEMGVKTDRARWAGTMALFRVEKVSEYNRSCGASCLTKVQDGKSIYQGLELGATARLNKLWSVGGNLMLLDTEYVEGNTYNGNQVVGAPKLVATTQVAYRVPAVPGLQVRLGAKHTGETPLRESNNLYVDSYTLVNLGATYDTKIQGYATTFRASINNLLDKEYWMYQYANYIKAGDPRTFNVSATLHF